MGSFEEELVEMDSNPSGQEIIKKAESELATFVALLDSITVIDERLKLLWKHIYENALIDRRNAYIIWTDLYLIVHGNPEQHVIHGDHMAKYMERMARCNDQLLKLAELVYKAKDKQETDEIPNSRDLFERMKQNRG